MKCNTCEDKGWHIPNEPWNLTLQEAEQCPDCLLDPDEITIKPSHAGLLT